MEKKQRDSEREDLKSALNTARANMNSPARVVPSAPSEASMDTELVIDLQSHSEKEEVGPLLQTCRPSGQPQPDKVEGVRKEFLCPCGEHFDKSVELAAHKRWSCKMKEKKAKCEICETWFATEQGLRRHMNHSHGGFASCSTCSRRFPNKMRLTKHWMEAHNKGESLPCFVCEKVAHFDSKYELECHLLAHKYEREQKRLDRQKSMSLSASQTVNPTPSAGPSSAITSPSLTTTPASGTPCLQTPPHHEPPPPPPVPEGSWPAPPHPPPPHGFDHSLHQGFPRGAHPRHPFHPRGPWMSHHRHYKHHHGHPHHHPFPPFGCPPPSPHTHPPPPSHTHPPPPPHTHPPPFHFHRPPYVSTPSGQSNDIPDNKNLLSSQNQALGDESVYSQADEPTTEHAPFSAHHSHPYPVWPAFYKHCPPDLHKYIPHQYMKQLRKMKWKKCMKHMDLEQVAQRFSDVLQPSHSAGETGSVTTDGRSASVNTSATPYKIACKFCNQQLERREIHRHRKKECPALPVNKCSVCDRTFKRRHHLFKHMHAYNHFSQPETVHGGTVATGSSLFSEETSVLSSLPERMDSVLKLKAAESTGPPFASTAMDETGKQNVHMASQGGSSRALKEHQQAMAHQSVSGEKNFPENKNSSTHACNIEGLGGDFQCIVCRDTFETKENMCQHLREHISHAIAIQKVREWTQKSSSYFFSPGSVGGESAEHDLTSFPSGLESEVSSVVTNTTGQDESGKFSSIETVASQDVKWKKYRNGKGHRQKGEVFVCELCNKQFSFKKDLKFHIKASHKDSMLECPVCHKKFRWTKKGQFYERHLNSHYGVNVFKYKCEVCSKTFLEKSKLKAHMSLHTKEPLHKCSVCGKGYGNKSSLVRHERKHTGEKPYKCDVCEKSFAEKRELLRHSASHTGVAPFSCSVCGQGFTLKTSLMTHMKKKHSEAAEN